MSLISPDLRQQLLESYNAIVAAGGEGVRTPISAKISDMDSGSIWLLAALQTDEESGEELLWCVSDHGQGDVQYGTVFVSEMEAESCRLEVNVDFKSHGLYVDSVIDLCSLSDDELDQVRVRKGQRL